jgi:hypothetical protein
VQLGGSSDESVKVLRSAGDDASCTNASKEAADPNCASPLQLFLTPVERPDPSDSVVDPSAVRITFPAREGEKWALYDANRKLICSTPCSRWVPPQSGYRLRSETASVDVPPELAYQTGGPAVAEFSPRRGSPTASAWLFWGLGAWLPFPGVTLTVLGIDAAAREPADCQPSADPFCKSNAQHPVFFLTSGAVFLGLFGASLYYYVVSEEESFSLRPDGSTGQALPTRLAVQVGPGVVRGTF